jgi:hypothetical protein
VFKIYLELTPSIVLSLLPPFLLRTISIGFILVFSYIDTKCIHHIYPMSTPPPTGTHPGKDLINDLFMKGNVIEISDWKYQMG